MSGGQRGTRKCSPEPPTCLYLIKITFGNSSKNYSAPALDGGGCFGGVGDEVVFGFLEDETRVGFGLANFGVLVWVVVGLGGHERFEDVSWSLWHIGGCDREFGVSDYFAAEIEEAYGF